VLLYSISMLTALIAVGSMAWIKLRLGGSPSKTQLMAAVLTRRCDAPLRKWRERLHGRAGQAAEILVAAGKQGERLAADGSNVERHRRGTWNGHDQTFTGAGKRRQCVPGHRFTDRPAKATRSAVLGAVLGPDTCDMHAAPPPQLKSQNTGYGLSGSILHTSTWWQHQRHYWDPTVTTGCQKRFDRQQRQHQR